MLADDRLGIRFLKLWFELNIRFFNFQPKKSFGTEIMVIAMKKCLWKHIQLIICRISKVNPFIRCGSSSLFKNKNLIFK